MYTYNKDELPQLSMPPDITIAPCRSRCYRDACKLETSAAGSIPEKKFAAGNESPVCSITVSWTSGNSSRGKSSGSESSTSLRVHSESE